MHGLNNLDVIILIVIGISALIALSRGLVKEVLSIVGWVLATMSIIYLLPVLMPFAKAHISSGILAGVVTALVILILFFIVWILLTDKLIGKIRTSKLNGLDRMLGLFFGIVRACLLVVLFYILVSWMIPADKQSEVLTKSKYFQIAGSFAKPLEELIPEETLQLIKEKAGYSETEEDSDEKSAKDEAAETKAGKDSVDDLFERLAQPQIKKAKNKAKEKIKENFSGYKESERDNLDRLIENVD